MVITFRNKKLEKLANDPRKGKSEWGQLRFEKVSSRLDQLAGASVLEDLRHVPGKFHELRENRKGQWAAHLDEPYRLVFVPHEDPIPLDAGGNYDWSAIRGVEIIEIINYHKEK